MIFLSDQEQKTKVVPREKSTAEGIMAAVAKPNTRAFRLRPDKVDQFVKRNGSFDKAMERFQAHRPKNGVETPSKGKHE